MPSQNPVADAERILMGIRKTTPAAVITMDADFLARDSAKGVLTSRAQGGLFGSEPSVAARDPVLDTEQHTIRVFIVSDVRLYREGLSALLGRMGHIAVVGAAGNPDEGAARVRDLQPDVVLLDAGAGRNVAAAHDIIGSTPNARVVALAAPEVEEDIIALAEAGVLGYVTRDESLDDLVMTIESVARDEMACSPWMATILVRRVQALAAERPRPTQRLTAREAEILDLIAKGLSNKEIGARLHIEVTTVKNHVHNILEKLGVSRREEAVARTRSSSPGTTGRGPWF
jgi:two-component system, NarL family, nitrate/nitrite response regulator NarL